jgi:hypothetical protein
MGIDNLQINVCDKIVKFMMFMFKRRLSVVAFIYSLKHTFSERRRERYVVYINVEKEFSSL